QVDLDHLVLEPFLGECDPSTRAVGTTKSVVQRQNQSTSTPKTSAICRYKSSAGGSSAGDAAVRATARTRAGSAFVNRATTVGFAPSAITSPGGSSPWNSGTDAYSSTIEPRSKST